MEDKLLTVVRAMGRLRIDGAGAVRWAVEEIDRLREENARLRRRNEVLLASVPEDERAGVLERLGGFVPSSNDDTHHASCRCGECK